MVAPMPDGCQGEKARPAPRERRAPARLLARWRSPSFRAYEVRALPGIILINPESRIHLRDVSISDLEKAVRSLVGGK